MDIKTFAVHQYTYLGFVKLYMQDMDIKNGTIQCFLLVQYNYFWVIIIIG
jgi:hypothetical protein